MTKASFSHVKISGVTTVVPSRLISLDEEASFYASAPEKLEKLKTAVGLDTRCVVDGNTTPADLCEEAAKHLIDGLKIDKETIDALICVLDFPDYRLPPTACVLHGKLEMPVSCLAFDINHGCAGYLYGLYVASSLIEAGSCKKVLLLVGDVKSRTINIKDRISAPIFGDGAAATLLEFSETECPSSYVIGANGKLHENIIIPAGGARMPCSEETRREVTDEFGNTRSLENFTMNGRAVFDFTMNTIPGLLKDTLEFARVFPDQVDYVVLHQANKSIMTNVAARAGFKDRAKVPTETLRKYGNLSVASVPGVFSDQLSERLSTQKTKLLISGFGVGLAWGAAIINTDKIYCPEPFVYGGEK